jgi:Type I phosphodiesterase / nucleotide pyrophosphatase
MGCRVIDCAVVSDSAPTVAKVGEPPAPHQLSADDASGPGGGSSTGPAAGAPIVVPEPLLPDFEGGSLHAVVPLIMSILNGTDGKAQLRELPSWAPDGLAEASQIVLLLLDGLGSEQLAARRSLAPVLSSGSGSPLTSVAPSTTACALTSLTTGLVPARHGVLGYRMALDGDVFNVLQWRLGSADARIRVPPPVFQPFPAFPGATGPVPVVTRYDYGPTGFSAAHLGSADLYQWYTPAGLVTGVRRLMTAGAPFVYAYYEGIDKVAHAAGLGDHFDDELRAVDRLVGDVLSVLPSGAVLVVTADHGQVEVGSSVEVLGDDIMRDVCLITGEGRFRWLHARPGAARDLSETASDLYGDIAWIRTREQIIDDGWLGGVPSRDVMTRMGDVALVPFGQTAFLDPADTVELKLKGRHGSLTADEMAVPFLAWPPVT